MSDALGPLETEGAHTIRFESKPETETAIRLRWRRNLEACLRERTGLTGARIAPGTADEIQAIALAVIAASLCGILEDETLAGKGA